MKYSAAVITISDKGSVGERVDTSGPALCEMLEKAGYEIAYTDIIPDEYEQIREKLIDLADEKGYELIVTTGGTGFSKRDVTPEATLSVLEKETRGIPEAMRYASLQITPRACLSREVAGIRGESLIINLPGSKKASTENLEAVLDSLMHGIDVLKGNTHDCGEEHHHHHG
jgi:molybdopterin adenylyltransferase